MALTLVVVYREAVGNILRRVVQVTGEASYTSGGSPLTKQTLGFIRLLLVQSEPAYAAGGGVFIPRYDYVNSTLRYFGMAAAAGVGTPLAEVAAATNLSTYVSNVIVEGY